MTTTVGLTVTRPTYASNVSTSRTAAQVESSRAAWPTRGDATHVYVEEFDALYKWFPLSSTTVDHYRVLGHATSATQSGRWILESGGIRLAPSTGATWTTLGAALVAMAYKGFVKMAAEAWTADVGVTGVTNCPNGTHLIIEKGATINGTIAFSPGTIPQNAIFYNHGGTTAPTAETTLASNAAVGATTLVLTNATGFDVGGWFRIMEGVAYTRTRKIIAKTGSTITLDKPMRRVFTTANAAVQAIPAARDITIEGNGVVITGGADALCQFASAVNVHLMDMFAEGWVGKFGWSYDLGSRDSTQNNVHCDSANVTPSNHLFANCEDIDVYDCGGIRAGVAGGGTGISLALPSCDNVNVWDGGWYDTDGSCCELSVEDATDTYGSRNCSFNGTFFQKGGSGLGVVHVINGSSYNVWNDCDVGHGGIGYAFSGGSATANYNTINRGRIHDNAQGGITANAASIGNKAVGTVLTGHPELALEVTEAARFALIDCEIPDTETAIASGALIRASGAGTIIDVESVRGSATRNTQHFVSVAGGAEVTIDGASRWNGGGTNNIAVIVTTGGKADVRALKLTDGDYGIWVDGATSWARLGAGCDVSAAVTPINLVSSGTTNRGEVTLSGATSKAVAFPGTRVGDQFRWTRKTASGTPADVASGAPNAGTGFTLTVSASDTSTLAYVIGA